MDEVSYQPEETAFSDGKDPSNIAKNRYPNILPCKCTCKIIIGDILHFIVNTFRPRLRIEGSASDYINASFVDVSIIHYSKMQCRFILLTIYRDTRGRMLIL